MEILKQYGESMFAKCIYCDETKELCIWSMTLVCPDCCSDGGNPQNCLEIGGAE